MAHFSASTTVFIEDLKVRSFRAKLSKELADEHISDLQCMRFINARSSAGIQAAVEMAEKWLEWRNSPIYAGSALTANNILERTDKDNICVGTAMHTHHLLIPHSLQGEDKDGRPVYWEKNGQISANSDRVKGIFSVDDLISMHVRTQELTNLRMENLSKKHGKVVDKSVVIFDLTSLPLMPDWMSLEYIRRTLFIDQNFYPETLHRLVIINSPWYFSTIFAIIKPWIDPNTATKIRILGYGYRPGLLELLVDDQIPVEYGGSHAGYVWTNSWSEESLCSQGHIDQFLLEQKQAAEAKAQALNRAQAASTSATSSSSTSSSSSSAATVIATTATQPDTSTNASP